MAARGARREDTCLVRARVMEAPQVMSLMQVLLVALELLVKEVEEVILKVMKEVEEVVLSSLSSTPPPRTTP